MSQLRVWQDTVSEDNLMAKMWLHRKTGEAASAAFTQKKSFLTLFVLDNALFCSDN